MTGEAEAIEAVPTITAPYRLAWEPFTAEQAELATNTANAYMKRTPMLVKELKVCEAWKALGYSSWSEFVDDRLVCSRQYAHQLVQAADKLEEIAAELGVPVDLIEIPERVLRGLPASTMVDAAAQVKAEAEPDATDVEIAAATASAIRQAQKAATAGSVATTAAARRRCYEHLTADPSLSVKELARAAGAPQAMAEDVWAEFALAEHERQEAEAQARSESPAPEVEAPAPSPSVPAPTSDEEPVSPPAGSSSDTSPGQDDDAPATSDVDTDPADDGGAGVGSGPSVTQLPDDWRDRLARSAQLLGCPSELLGPVLTEDDVIDLTDLYGHIEDVLIAHRELTA